MHSRLTFGPNAILSRSNIYSALLLLFVSVNVTVVSSLKSLISRFILSFTYFKEFKNAKII